MLETRAYFTPELCDQAELLIFVSFMMPLSKLMV